MIRFRLLLIALVCLLSMSITAYAATQSKSNDEDACDNVHMGDDYGATAKAVEELTAPAGSPLKIIAARNGGVRVRGADVNEFKVHVCKYAHADSKQQATSLLSQLHASINEGALQAQGPENNNDDDDDSGHWTVFFIVDAPRTASVDVTGNNGPISVRDLSGSVHIEAKNGPVALKHISGDATVHAKNGPIAFSGSGGSIKLQAVNGPIDIHLLGSSWNGSGLDARTNNGPVSLSLPASYNSGVQVETEGHSPVSCSAKGCERVPTSYMGEARTMNFGTGSAVVRIATDNGPVAISNTHAEY